MAVGGHPGLSSVGGAAGAKGEAIVAVAQVTRQDLAKDLTVQAELRPFQEIGLHLKIAGYFKATKVEVGDHVRKGDLNRWRLDLLTSVKGEREPARCVGVTVVRVGTR